LIKPVSPRTLEDVADDYVGCCSQLLRNPLQLGVEGLRQDDVDEGSVRVLLDGQYLFLRGLRQLNYFFRILTSLRIFSGSTVGEIYLKDGVEPGKIAYKIAEKTGMSHRWVVKYLPNTKHFGFRGTRAGLRGRCGLWAMRL